MIIMIKNLNEIARQLFVENIGIANSVTTQLKQISFLYSRD